MRTSIKDLLKNLLFSFCSYALPLAVLQFIVQPIIANILGPELNGQFLTLMSINYFLIGITASVLNTVRMLQHNEYKEKNYIGDFNIFFIIYTVFFTVAMPISFVFYTGRFDFIDILLYVFIGLLYLYHDYIFSQYRIELKYNKILINNIIIVLGYFIGLPLFLVTKRWQLIIITAYFLSGVYDLFNTTFLREPIKKTPLFTETRKKVMIYTLSYALSSFITYCDKLILYPILGGTLVSIYYTASMIGKLLMLMSSPLNSVLMGYLINIDDQKFRIKPKMVLIIALGCVVAYMGCLIVGYPIIDFLYPDWAMESQKYLPLTVLGSLFGLIVHLINTVAIRFLDASLQIKLQLINLIFYLVVSLVLLHLFSLWGFCLGIVCSNIFRLIVLIILIRKHFAKSKIKS